jgi:hypothetical protein
MRINPELRAAFEEERLLILSPFAEKAGRVPVGRASSSAMKEANRRRPRLVEILNGLSQRPIIGGKGK